MSTAYDPPTDEILALLRTTIGSTATIGTAPDTLTVTWKSKPEAPVLRWMQDKSARYPAVVLDPGETEQAAGDPGPNILRCVLPVTLSLVIDDDTLQDTTAEDTMYRNLRKLGEAVVSTLMNAGPDLGSNIIHGFDVVTFGRDDETPELLERADVGVYRIVCEATYHQPRPRPA